MLVNITARADDLVSIANDLPREHVGDGSHHADRPDNEQVGHPKSSALYIWPSYRTLPEKTTLQLGSLDVLYSGA